MNNRSNDVKDLKKEIRKRDLKIKELETLVSKDQVTGLYNRRGFLELADKLFRDVQFNRQHPDSREHFVIDAFSIIFFDIDNFKKINDTYGHKVGDQILRYVASIIEGKTRVSDFVGRWGGEEMVVALIGAEEKDAYLKAEEMRKAIRSRVKIPGYPELKVTVSVGVAELDGNSTLEEVIKKSDQAMYQAKKSGKDRVVKFSDLKS